MISAADNLELGVIREADAKKLLDSGNLAYWALNDKVQALKARVQSSDKRVADLEKEVNTLK